MQFSERNGMSHQLNLNGQSSEETDTKYERAVRINSLGWVLILATSACWCPQESSHPNTLAKVWLWIRWFGDGGNPSLLPGSLEQHQGHVLTSSLYHRSISDKIHASRCNRDPKSTICKRYSIHCRNHRPINQFESVSLYYFNPSNESKLQRRMMMLTLWLVIETNVFKR